VLEVPEEFNYNYIMEIKLKNGEWVKIEKGDLISDGFEEGMVCSILMDEGDLSFGLWDGKEGWSVHLREILSVNGKDVEIV
tara:strand:- start:41 stop:283 length:243 start_codon:yes stop_codon:yes gene_type:complete